ncbi:hypothetical protein [Sphingopyxis sp. H115]|uniref:hypothetical protein n=1 Tax=Sphingopyxis sp. H115 TaxID=1759073 RepID=UPI000735F577|nr:hypothetical protein [Sphingopyxis sp. H115]KTE03368.1 hypothetical protein ATE71_19575 [Sphingopyxis sp. H115]
MESVRSRRGGRRPAAVLVTAVLLTGCGSQSAAADDGAAAATRLEVAAQSAPAAAPKSLLPIEQGLYAFADDGCGSADTLFFYDGANTGEIGSDGTRHWTNAAVSISRVGPARKPLDANLAKASRGFTLVWDAQGDRDGHPSLALKATAPGRFTYLSMGSFGEISYAKCAFAQLSPGMQAAVRSEQPHMARPVARAMPAGAPAPVASDEDAVRAIVGRIYGWRDGREVQMLDEWDALFGPRIGGLLAQCGTARDNADPRANGGEGPYTVLGDQGCLGVPFLIDPMTGEPAPSVRKARPIVRGVSGDAIEVDIAVPPADRRDWWDNMLGQTIRFQRVGNRWLIDEIVTRTTTGTERYSSVIEAKVADLRKIARKPRRR